jgi:hypothetical protein
MTRKTGPKSQKTSGTAKKKARMPPVIPFSDQYGIRREAADSANARQGEATTCRIDMEME